MKITKELILTLPLTSHMVESAEYRTGILNWVTSYPEISGVYVIVECERNTKQVCNEIFLDSMLKMLTELREADLSVTIGYTNTESLLYLITGDVNITFGAYENTRMFSNDKFVVNEEERRGPKARIYLPGLLNWVQFSQAKDIKNDAPEIWKMAHLKTEWSEPVFDSPVEPSFNQPPLYRHHFECFSGQVDMLRPLSRLERYAAIRGWIKDAIAMNASISEIPMDLERHGSGDHLQPWLNVINRYYAANLKA